MRRALADLPPLHLPQGYEIRHCGPDDAADLARLLSLAFQEPWTTDRADKEFFQSPSVFRTFGVIYGGALVATASAQIYPANAPHIGTVHWVGADPVHKGKGLGYAVSLQVLHELSVLGCREANLTTDDPRLAAIRTYLKLGFTPYHTDGSHAVRWQKVMELLG